MEKIKRRLNNSASLGKTLSRNQHACHHSLAHPNQFQMISSHYVNPKISLNRLVESTPKLSAKQYKIQKINEMFSQAEQSKINTSQVLMRDGMINKKSNLVIRDIKQAIIQKSLRLNRMFQNMHNFIVCIDEVKWILHQSYRLLENKIAQLQPTLQMSNTLKQFDHLVKRFDQIDRTKLKYIQNYIFDQRKRQNWNQFNPQGKTYNNSYVNYDKENVNEENNLSHNISSHFQNINIKQSLQKPEILKQNQGFYTKKTEESQQHLEKMHNQNQLAQQQKINEVNNQQMYLKFRRQEQENDKLLAKNENLTEQMNRQLIKLSKYKGLAYKTINQINTNLLNLARQGNMDENNIEVRKLRQTIATWQQMIQEEDIENKYRQFSNNEQKENAFRMQKLQQIVGLQYDINRLLALRQSQQNRVDKGQDFYRQLIIQAATIEQLCKM